MGPTLGWPGRRRQPITRGLVLARLGFVFGTTIAKVRTFTRFPILISETAVGRAAGPGKVADLFGGARAAGHHDAEARQPAHTRRLPPRPPLPLTAAPPRPAPLTDFPAPD